MKALGNIEALTINDGTHPAISFSAMLCCRFTFSFLSVALKALACRLFGFCFGVVCALATKDNVPANCVDELNLTT